MAVFDQIENVTDKDSLALFLSELALDYKDHHDEWQNWSIDDYLKSISALINRIYDKLIYECRRQA